MRDGLVVALHAVHPSPRYGIREHVPGSGGGIQWAGYAEVLGRCLTHALLDGACWLAHMTTEQVPHGRFTVATSNSSDVLFAFAGQMCLRFWDDTGGSQTSQHRSSSPPGLGASHLRKRSRRPYMTRLLPKQCHGF